MIKHSRLAVPMRKNFLRCYRPSTWQGIFRLKTNSTPLSTTIWPEAFRSSNNAQVHQRSLTMWSPRSRYLPLLTLWSTILLCIAPVLGADMYIYPTKGQTPEQQAQDKSECHAWAVQQTQFDPTQSSAAPPSASAAVPQGGGIRGAGRGAAVGAVGGA